MNSVQKIKIWWYRIRGVNTDVIFRGMYVFQAFNSIHYANINDLFEFNGELFLRPFLICFIPFLLHLLAV